MSASQDALRTIAYISQFDKKRAARLQEEYNRRKTDKNDKYYAGTYSAPTNQAVSNLTALGFDTSRLNQDWYKQNESWIQDNLEYRSGTTNAPSAPTKKSSWENRVAYELYQWGNSEEQTQKAEKQWNQLQKELAYYAGNPGWNYSDDYILNNKIDWSKYNLLTEMDEEPNPLNPREYNRAIGYSKDAVNGTLWAARNGGGTGDDMLNAGMYYLGEGNMWQEDPKVSAKLNPENPDFNPYDIGSTNMHKEGQILGMYSASRDWVDSDEFKEMYYSDDPEEKAAAENWYNAEMRLTRPAEDARDALYGYIDSFLSDGVTDAGVVRAGIDAALDGGKLYTYQKGNETVYTTKKPSVKDYKEIDLSILNKIDMTVGKTDENGNRSLPVNDEKDLLTFTREIGYKYDSTIQQVEELCARNAEILKEADTVNDIIDLGMGPLNPALFEAEPATVGTEPPQMQSPGQITGQDTRTGTQPGTQGTPSPEINTGAQTPAGTGSDSVTIDAVQDAMKNGRMSSPTDLPAAQPEPAQVPTTPAIPKITEAEAGEIEAGNKKINEARTAVETEGVTTETETAAMKYAGSVAFNRIKNQLTAIRINPGIMQGVVQKDINIASKGVMDSGLNYAHSIAEYETTKIRNDANQERYAALEAKYGDIQYYQKEAPEAIEKQIGDYTVILTLDTANPDGPKYVVSDIHSSYATYNEIMDTAWGEDLKKQAEMLGEPDSKEAAKILNAQSVVAANGEQGAVEIEEYKSLSAQISKDSQALEQGKENYDKAADGLKKTVNKLNMMADSAYMMGVDPSGVRDAFRFLDDMLNYHDEPAVPMQDRTKLEMIDAYAEYTGMEYDSAKKSEILHKQISDVEARIKKIDEDIAYAQGIGYQIPGNYARNMQLKRKDLENEKKALEYSAILTDTSPEELETAINAAKAFEEKYGEGSMNYWVNLFDNADGFRTIMKNDRYTLREDGEDASEYSTITEDEKKTYYYLLGKKILEMGGSLDEALENIGKDPKAAEAALREIFSDASEYEKFMESDQSGYGLWNNREYDQSVEYGRGMVQSGTGGGIEANLMATGATVGESIASALYTFDRLISGGRFNEKAFANRLTGTKNAIREETRKSIDEYYKDNPLMKTIANIGYEIYCNRGDSAMNAMFFGMLFPELGNPILSELLGSTPMGFTAGLNAATEAVRNGANTEQAWLILGTTFMAETMTEALTRSNIMEALGEGRELTKETLGQFFKEWLTKSGVEEMFGESANDLIENFFNRGTAEWFDNPNFESDHQKLIDKYYAEGYTEPGAAEAKAYEEEMNGIAHTAFVSYLSAGADVVAKVGRAAVNTVKTAVDVVNGYRKKTRADQKLGGSSSMLDNMIRDYKKAKSGVPAAVAMGGPNTNKNASGQEAGAAAPETMQAAQTAADERFTKAEQGRREARETLDAANEEYDRAYSNARSKEIKLDNAKKGLKAAQKGGNQEHIAKAQAAMDAAQEEANQARTARMEANMKRNAAREQMERADSEYDEAGRAIASENATPDQKQASADVATLQRVEGSTPVTQTETLASILDNVDGDEVTSEQASAAAALLMKRFGENTNYIVQQVMNGTAKTAESRELVTTALQNAALGNGAATAVMQSADFQNASPEQKVQMLVATIAQDQANQAVQQNSAARVRDFRIAMGVNNLAANGHFDGAVSAQAAAQDAGKDVSKAKTALTEKEQALDQAMTDVRQKTEALASDPSDQNMKAHQAAVTTAENMDESRKQYEDHLAKEQEKKDAADAKATQETENAMRTAREQAAQEVDQIDQQRAADQQAAAKQQRIAAEQAAEAERQQRIADSRSGKTAEESARAKIQRLAEAKGYTGEQAEKFVNDVMNYWQTGQANKVDMSKQFSKSEGYLMMGALSRRFGVNVEITDIATGENGFYNPNTNTITLNSNLPAGQVLVEFALHELTHSLEGTGHYKQYHDTVLNILFPSEAELNDAIARKLAEYEDAGRPLMNDENGTADEKAKREIVAEFTRLKLHDKDMVQRIVDGGMGGRIRQALHNVNQFLKNIRLTGEARTEAENLRRTERMFQKAIREREKMQQKANETAAQQDNAVANPIGAAQANNTESRKPFVRASDKVSGETRYVKLPDGSVKSFNQTANSVARDVNKVYKTNVSNSSISSGIQNARNMFIHGDAEGAVNAVFELAKNVEKGIGMSRTSMKPSALAQALNGFFGNKVIPISESDANALASVYGSVAKANRVLADAGVKARLRLDKNNNNTGLRLDDVFRNDSHVTAEGNGFDISSALGGVDTARWEDILHELDHQRETYANQVRDEYTNGGTVSAEDLQAEIYATLWKQVVDYSDVTADGNGIIQSRGNDEAANSEAETDWGIDENDLAFSAGASELTDAQKAQTILEAGIGQKNTEGYMGNPTVSETDKAGIDLNPSGEEIINNDAELVKLDEQYKAAVESGDMETATDLLMDKLKKTSGIIPFMAPNWHAGAAREIAELLKTGNSAAISIAATSLQEYVPDNAVLIPMPGRSGKVADNSWTMQLCNAISELTGRPVVVALEGKEHESRQEAKHNNKKGASKEELGFRQVADIPEATVPIFIDNTIGKGVTADAARDAMGGGITLAYTKTTRSKGIEGLKNAIVTYDKNGDLIPLSQRFDVSKRDVKYSTGESSDMTDAQYMQALKEAGTDYMSAVARGDMKAAQEDVDFYADQKGYVNDGFHGTLNGGFTVFDKQKAHIGGNSGAGFYFSSNPDDSEANYSDIEGADNHFKVEHLAEKIQDYIAESGENEYAGVQIPEDASFEDLEEIAKKMLTGSPQTYHVRLNPGKAYIRNFNNSTNLIEDVYDSFDESDYNRDDFDSDDEYEEAIWEGRSDALYEAISNAVYNGIADVDSNFEIISNVDYESIISSLAMQATDYDSLTWDDVSKVIGEQYIDALVGDGEESADATMEITRAIVEAFGFDSIEDREVGKKFNQLKNMGAGDTVHYIMFRPDQIKLADPVTYDNDGNVIPLEKRFSNSLDIRYSAGASQMTEAQKMQALREANVGYENAIANDDMEAAQDEIEFALNTPIRNFSTDGMPVQMRDDGLIAVHNLSLESLYSVMRMGGFPMASIALLNKDKAWTMYGDISVFFGQNSVDPASGGAIYNGDAYTPTLGSNQFADAAEALTYLLSQQERDFSVAGTDMTKLFSEFKKINNLDEARRKAYSDQQDAGERSYELSQVKEMEQNLMWDIRRDLEDNGRELSEETATAITRGILFAAEDIERNGYEYPNEKIDAIRRNITESLGNAGIEDHSFDSSIYRSALKYIDAASNLSSNAGIIEGKTANIQSIGDMQAIVLPNTVPDELIDQLTEMGLPRNRIRLYDPNATEGANSREKVLKSIPREIPGVQFSVQNDQQSNAELSQALVDAGVITADELEDYQQTQTQNPLEGQNPTMSTAQGPAQRAFGDAEGMLRDSDEIAGFAKAVAEAQNSYFPDTNNEQVYRAIKWIRSLKQTPNSDGYAEAMNAVTRDDFDYRSADGQARMVAVMGMAVAKNDTMAQVALADAFNRQGTDLGRALQARKLFKLMTPAGRISTLQKMIDNYNVDLKKNGEKDIKFSHWVYEAAAAAETAEDFHKVLEVAASELASQLPINWKERLQSLRMVSMLANPRTHIRNIVGNALFIPAVGIKNKIGAILEKGFVKKGERTKTLSPFLNKEIREFARQDAKAIKDTLTGEAKYDENTLVQKAKNPLGPVLGLIGDLNSKALEGEDWIFLKGHYRRALGSWMQANGYTVEQVKNDPKLLEKGREYAVNEAQKATYRDFNGAAQWLNQIAKKNAQTLGQKAIAFTVNAALPFKKTPANILKRGIEYSPLGIARSVYNLGKRFRGGEISANQVIDQFTSGLSGTAVMALGFLLAGTGAVSCGFDDDDWVDELEGKQKYSIKMNLFGKDITYTMDWAAPMAMPFFVGAAIRNQADEEGFDAKKSLSALLTITEPVFNLSMLDGVNSLLKTSSYSSDSPYAQIGAKVLSNYATSYVSSVLGAIARTMDETQRKSYVKKEDKEDLDISGVRHYAIEQIENKIPGVSQSNIPVRDVWGRAKVSSLAERIIENFISPGYVEHVEDDPVVNELGRLFDSTKSPYLEPKHADQSVDGKGLEAEIYDTFDRVHGETQYSMLKELFGIKDYQDMSDDDAKVEIVRKVYSYANKVAMAAIDDDYRYEEQTASEIIKDGKIADYKSKMIQCMEDGNWEGYNTYVEALQEEGVEDSTIKDKIGDKYRDQWKNAYRDYRETGEEKYISEMMDIEEMLDETGFDFNIHGKNGWESKVDEEYEAETDSRSNQEEKQEEEKNKPKTSKPLMTIGGGNR